MKKKNLLFLSLLILVVLLLSSCFLNPPTTEGILKGQILVPEGSIQTKDLTGQALPGATVNIINLSTGKIIATTTTDTTGHYQVSVPPGGPYLLEAVKGSVKLEQITCQVEVGIDYDLGTADCVTTAAALIAQAMMDAGDNPADIDCADIIADSNFDDVSSIVCATIKAGQDPTTSAAVLQAVEDFLNLSAPTSSPTPVPASPTPINIKAILGLTAPVEDAIPVTTIAATAQYTGTVTWLPVDDPFQGYKVYVATIILIPEAGFTLTGVADNFFTVDGAITVTNSTNSGVVTAIFPTTSGPVDAYFVTTEHSGTETAGTPFSVTITAKDSKGNTATGYTGPHAVAWTWDATNSPSGTAPSELPVGNQTFSAGVVTVTGFTLTNSSETPTITVTADGISSSTSTIKVNNGTLSYVKIEDEAGGTGSEVGTHSMSIDDVFTVYAAGRDICGNYISDQSVDWTGTGICSGQLSSTIGISNTFTSTETGAGTITADHNTLTDDTTGTITVWNLKVTYIGNGNTSGTAPTDSNPYASGEEVTILSKGNLIKEQDGISVLFTGWNTSSTGSAKTNVGATFIMGDTNVTLYAQWSFFGSTGPGGGFIFYDKGSYSDDWRYLEVAPISTEWTYKKWSTANEIIGTQETGIGSGKVNTDLIVAAISDETGRAAQLCDALDYGGCSDWFLPSKDELNLIYTNLVEAGVGVFPGGGIFWSSSEGSDENPEFTDHYSQYYAWVQGFYNGKQFRYTKEDSSDVRAVRAF